MGGNRRPIAALSSADALPTFTVGGSGVLDGSGLREAASMDSTNGNGPSGAARSASNRGGSTGSSPGRMARQGSRRGARDAMRLAGDDSAAAAQNYFAGQDADLAASEQAQRAALRAMRGDQDQGTGGDAGVDSSSSMKKAPSPGGRRERRSLFVSTRGEPACALPSHASASASAQAADTGGGDDGQQEH